MDSKLAAALNFFDCLFGVPKFRFNKKLFGDLIREGPDGKTIEAPAEEPEVIFKRDPPSGVLGMYNPKTKRITVEVLSNYLACLMKGDRDLRERFDAQMTSTVAHEGGHWQLRKRHGIAPMLEKLAIHGVCLAIGFIIAWVSLNMVYRIVASLYAAIMGPSHVVLPILEVIVFTLIFLFFEKMYVEVWHALTFSVTYRLCYDERYARAFEKKTETDPRWNNVINLT